MVSISNHVNHIIMSTTHHQVAEKCNSSEACEFTGENTLGRETVAPGVAEVGSVSAVWGLDLAKFLTTTLLLCGFATGCDQTHWHGCAQPSIQ
jgi:hypothetical protein